MTSVETATMPVEFFTWLLEAALFMGFDLAAYLSDNADV